MDWIGLSFVRSGRDIIELKHIIANKKCKAKVIAKIEKPEEVNKYLPGEEVTILDGPFTNFNGKVESVKGDKVKVEVSIFGRVSLIEVGLLQIDKKRD